MKDISSGRTFWIASSYAAARSQEVSVATIMADGSVRSAPKEVRQARKGLSSEQAAALGIIIHDERAQFVYEEGLCRALAGDTGVAFLTFSCLGSVRGREELLPRLDDTYFFRSRRIAPVAYRLLECLREHGIPSTLEVILPDLEPCRTWGWSVDQEEITLGCMLMREQADLPEGVSITLWSEIEEEAGSGGFDACTRWAREMQALLIHQETEHLRGFPEIVFRGGVQSAAVRQVGAYAFEGELLQRLRPGCVLMQSEYPHERKDRMYQLRRREPLPIIHPFHID